ncbi:MAG TPA: M48 family metallopeptidase [Pyrinomonadaceae bacterium]|jgi:Zn-dependent protease with chaperone function
MKRARPLISFLLGAALLAQLACSGALRGGGGGQPTSGARPAPHFKPGFNLFTPEQDVQLGQQSAQQIAQQVPLMNDAPTLDYVRALGAKLAARAPGFKFPYQFNVVGTRDINAFALPGGFVFVNAGALAAATNEGELAGVMAHEIAHVALRHGTNQASKAYVAQRGLGVISEVLGGRDSDLGQIVGQIGGLGANVLFLRFGRTAESQADLEGARIMAEAGYDPRDMANFFKTLARQGGQRAPEFLSDHPDPGNRVTAINNALPSLGVSKSAVHDTPQFDQVKARLTGGAAAGALRSSDELERKGPRDPDNMPDTARPAPPAGQYSAYQARDGAIAFEYPANWDALSTAEDESNLIFAPRGAYGELNNSVVVTHGIFIGEVAPAANDLRQATAAFVQQQIEANSDFRLAREPQQINFNGRAGYVTVVAGPSPLTGVVEVDAIYTTAAADGRLFYLITIAPEDEYKTYQPAFDHIIGTLRLAG